MKYRSTRRASPEVGLSDALTAGLAPDGGLYVPVSVPRVDTKALALLSNGVEVAQELLAPFFEGDPLREHLAEICAEAYELPLPIEPLASKDDYVVELFHGPTAAFKDFGARFLAAALSHVPRDDQRALTILVATSGDTGAAVASAFHRRQGFRVVVLYPDNRVSPRQAHQLGCFGDNVTAVRLHGSFDDCQRLVKEALADADLQSRIPLTSANSISIGRFLPQIAYYGIVALEFFRRSGGKLNLVIPTGNLGNALAAVYAREMRLPIGEIALATNANDVLPRFFDGEAYEPKESVSTLANAMDVGTPSNFERLRYLFPDERELRRSLFAFAVSDEAIRETIKSRYVRYREFFCPHTATAVHTLERLRSKGFTGDWAVVATAHPAKFESIVEPLTNSVDVPDTLATLLARESSAVPLENDYSAFRALLLSGA